MKKLLPLQIAVYGVLGILSFIIVFHLLVIVGLIPFDIIWGGNISEKTEMYAMEAISIAVNMVMLFIVSVYSGIIKLNISHKLIIGAVWVMFVFFLLNTLGNLLAKKTIETYIFTPLTCILSIFCYRIAAFDYEQKKSRA